MSLFRTFAQRCSVKKAVLKSFVKFAWRHLQWNPILNVVRDLGLELYRKQDSIAGVLFQYDYVIKTPMKAWFHLLTLRNNYPYNQKFTGKTYTKRLFKIISFLTDVVLFFPLPPYIKNSLTSTGIFTICSFKSYKTKVFQKHWIALLDSSSCISTLSIRINSLSVRVAVIQKPVN